MAFKAPEKLNGQYLHDQVRAECDRVARDPHGDITFTVGRHMLQNIYNRDQMGSP